LIQSDPLAPANHGYKRFRRGTVPREFQLTGQHSSAEQRALEAFQQPNQFTEALRSQKFWIKARKGMGK
jgi:hypothetical protein